MDSSFRGLASPGTIVFSPGVNGHECSHGAAVTRYTLCMTRQAEKLLSEALKLPDDEKAALVAEILKTLPPALPDPACGDAEWLTEVERRAREALAGSPGVSMEEAFAKARSKLRGA